LFKTYIFPALVFYWVDHAPIPGQHFCDTIADCWHVICLRPSMYAWSCEQRYAWLWSQLDNSKKR